MLRTDGAPLPEVVRDLEPLAARFSEALLDAPDDAGRHVDALLKRIGEALATDHVAFETLSDIGDAPVAVRVWASPSTALGASLGAARRHEPSLVVPVASGGRHVARLAVGSRFDGQPWPSGVQDRLRMLASLMALALRFGEQAALGAIDAGDDDFKEIVGDSPALRLALNRVIEVAPTDAPALLVGETGTGKALFARAVHDRSRRRGRPFVRVNCAALPPTLIESELFGHERGAFTGATATRRGRFEAAHTGTLFLDEIGGLQPGVQAGLLRVLQEGVITRVGSPDPRRVDVRIVAGTHQDLAAAVKDGRFRADLYYRLCVFPIALPPLRERIEDIPRLVWFFVNQRQRALNRRFTSIPAHVLAALQQHPWPGNVRELENVIERAMIHSTGSALLIDDAPEPAATREGATLASVERRYIETVLRRCRWRINGRGNAADVLGLHPNTLRFRMKKLGVQRPRAGGMAPVGRLSA
jgi:transcriptional regulator with GAF, ATPase, and Fis domain